MEYAWLHEKTDANDDCTRRYTIAYTFKLQKAK